MKPITDRAPGNKETKAPIRTINEPFIQMKTITDGANVNAAVIVPQFVWLCLELVLKVKG